MLYLNIKVGFNLVYYGRRHMFNLMSYTQHYIEKQDSIIQIHQRHIYIIPKKGKKHKKYNDTNIPQNTTKCKKVVQYEQQSRLYYWLREHNAMEGISREKTPTFLHQLGFLQTFHIYQAHHLSCC